MSPFAILALVIGGLYSSLFQIWLGKKPKDLATFFLAAILGIGLGQLLGNIIKANFLMLGPLHLIEITLFSWIMMFIANWIKLPPNIGK